jgi:thymidylate kinase
MPFIRDRIEEADRSFFERVAVGFQAISKSEPERVKIVDATKDIIDVRDAIWKQVEPLVN